ncbi:MAG: hypothetical protein DRJ52_10825 [Thermoprotei archaeon]|nr:MAG: hypothetical protein DRJ52_10825 [Thermoprotei archaeon]
MSETVIFVEGPSDRGVVSAILKKLNLRKTIKIRLMRGNKLEFLPKYINAYKCKIVVLKDLHTYNEEYLLARFNRIKNMIEKSLREHIYLIVVKKAIEAWLLADIESITSYYKRSIKVHIGDPEKIDDPAEELDKILNKCNKRYIKNENIAHNLALQIDLQKACRKSRSLSEFIKIISYI